jgi:hypothetical protein
MNVKDLSCPRNGPYSALAITAQMLAEPAYEPVTYDRKR